MEIRRIAVIGAGLMGHGIAQEFALAGFDVRIVDLTDETLAHGLGNMRRNLQTLADAGHISVEQVDAVPAGIRATTSLAEAVHDADVVIEAIVENLVAKRALFLRLDELCPEGAILASNTSSFMPSSLASATTRPERVLVAHYFNPPYLIPLVEIVPSPDTAPEVVDTVHRLLSSIGKQPALVRKEAVGFIANRMQIALLREAMSIVARGIATFDDVDRVVRNSFGARLAVAGPFEIADLAGLDVYSSASAVMLPDLESSTVQSDLIASRVALGDLGVKTGRGFYEWTPESAEALRSRMAEALLRHQAH